jgi:large subunit ribosomal protein L24e
MANCSFCKCLITPGTGKIFAMNDGKILNFCSNKCEKNHFKLGRKARFLKWTGAFMKGTVKVAEKKVEGQADEAAEKQAAEKRVAERLEADAERKAAAARSAEKRAAYEKSVAERKQ